MSTAQDIQESASQFSRVAEQFCSTVDAAFEMNRKDFLVRIYSLLPKLINEAIQLPSISLSDDDEPSDAEKIFTRMNEQEWGELYQSLKKHLGEWDLYWQVFDPTTDREADAGSLADDLADTYRDLKEGLLQQQCGARVEEIIWDWRLHFYSHWGKHAMDALLTCHFRLQGVLE